MGKGEIVEKMNEIKLPHGKETLDYYELILTENCNLRCKYCFDDSYSDRSGCNYNYVMGLEMIDDVINFIESTRVRDRKITVSFFGGEPTVNWKFIEGFIEKAYGKGYLYSMNTNVTLLTTKKIDFMVTNRIYPIMSIDGTREAHDINRIDINKKGTWTRIMNIAPELISKFRSVGMTPTVMMVVSPNSCQYIEESYEFLTSLGVIVNILYDYNSFFTEEQYSIIKKQLNSLFIEKRRVPYLDLERRIWDRGSYKQKNLCHVPSVNVTISPKGDLFFCHRLAPKMNEELHNCNKESFGNIYEGYINKKYINKMTERTNIDIFRKNRKCDKCPAVIFCKGGCIGSIRNGNNDSEYNSLLPTLCKMNLLLYEVFLGEKGEKYGI